MHDALAAGDPEVARILEASPRGVSMVIGPTGDSIGGTLSDSEGIHNEERAWRPVNTGFRR